MRTVVTVAAEQAVLMIAATRVTLRRHRENVLSSPTATGFECIRSSFRHHLCTCGACERLEAGCEWGAGLHKR